MTKRQKFEDAVKKASERRITGKHGDMMTDPECSFCGKKRTEVVEIIAGPAAFICNECVQLCTEILGIDHPEWLEGHKQFLDRTDWHKKRKEIAELRSKN